MTVTPTHAAAREYAARLWPVLPLYWITTKNDERRCGCGKIDCISPGKHPIREAVPHGVKDASHDLAMVDEWFTRWPLANVGIATGAASGIDAVDVDPRNDGDRTLAALLAVHGDFPDTAVANTGGGGLHYFFKHHGPLPGKLGPGIDVKSTGGYVVAAPSMHISGGVYQWEGAADPLDGQAVADTPSWLAGWAPAALPAAPVSGAVGFIPPAQAEDVRAALAHVDADDRGNWINVGMALKSTDAGQAAFDLWDEWSQRSPKYNAAIQRKTWAGFAPDGRLHLQSIFTWAAASGWINPNRGADLHQQAQAFAEAEAATQSTTVPQLRAVSLQGFMQAVLPSSAFVVDPIIPAHFVTLLGGHGGAGKSILALTIAAHVAAGHPWGPFPVLGGRVVVASLEDPGTLVCVRLRHIVERYQLDAAAVAANLQIVDCVDGSPELMVAGDYGHQLAVGPALVELRAIVAGGARLILVDNASDAFGGDENNRRQVRTFLRELSKLARSAGAAVLLLAHIDKQAAKFGANGNSYSGSTQWHNSARSRLALVVSDGRIELRHEKLNLGRTADSVPLQWADGAGVLIPVITETGLATVTHLSEAADDRDVLAAIRHVIEAGQCVPTARTGGLTTLHVLQRTPIWPDQFTSREGQRRFWLTLDRLRMRGVIFAEEYRTATRKTRERWSLVQQAPQDQLAA